MPAIAVNLTGLHAAQQEIFDNLTDRSVLRCGRRFGKTTLLEDIAVTTALCGLSVGWFTPTYKLLTPSYRHVLRNVRPALQSSNRTDGLIVTRTGGSIEFWTLEDEDAGRSRSYDLVFIDEASLKKGLKETWQKSIAPTLLDRRGKAILAGTPKGIDPENFYYEVCTNVETKYDPVTNPQGWREFHAPTSRNPMLDAEGVANLVNEYPPLVYQQEFLAEFVDWTGSAFFALANLLVNGNAVPYPPICQTVYAVIDTAMKTGKENDGTSVTYFALDIYSDTPLTIVDWDMQQIEGSLLEVWLPSVLKRCDELARICNARLGTLGAWIEDKGSGTILLQQAIRGGLLARPIESVLTAAGKDERALSVSRYVYSGKVKIAREAYDKQMRYKGVVKNHFLSQVLGFRVGVKEQKDDALDTFTYGIAIGLGNSEGF